MILYSPSSSCIIMIQPFNRTAKLSSPSYIVLDGHRETLIITSYPQKSLHQVPGLEGVVWRVGNAVSFHALPCGRQLKINEGDFFLGRSNHQMCRLAIKNITSGTCLYFILPTLKFPFTSKAIAFLARHSNRGISKTPR